MPARLIEAFTEKALISSKGDRSHWHSVSNAI
jgi:hypothetical protein